MQKVDDEFLNRIQETFIAEADEHIRNFCIGLVELGKTPSENVRTGIIETLFREIHSLKGAARSVGNKETEAICIPLESVFSVLKRRELAYTTDLNSIFYNAADLLNKTVGKEKDKFTEEDRLAARELIKILNDTACLLKLPAIGRTSSEGGKTIILKEEKHVNEGTAEKPVQAHNPETIRVTLKKLDPLFYQAEELLQGKIIMKQRSTELEEIHAFAGEIMTDVRRIKSSVDQVVTNNVARKLNDLEIKLNRLENFTGNAAANSKRDQYLLSRMVEDHLESMKQVMMLPVMSLVETFPSMVREISRNLGKEIKLIIKGSELDLDKRVLEELKVPLIHLIRNSIDHGIIKRKDKGADRPYDGTITIEFTAVENSRVKIAISDDGAGININKIIRAAVKAGVLSESDSVKIDRQEAINLIYMSGISTSPIITEISGHGLGMSIVREKILNLNGTISIQSTEGIGTTFTIILPASLSTFRGVVVSQSSYSFIIPSMNVEKVLMVSPDEIKSIENHATITAGGSVLPVVALKDAMGLPEIADKGRGKNSAFTPEKNTVLLIIISAADKRIALKIDEVLGEQHVLVKGLGALLPQLTNISGATIMGDGRIVPVLNPFDLVLSSINTVSQSVKQEQMDMSREKQGNILVVEDSITSRTMLKNVLETAGYTVVTAFDGLDGFTKARSEEFDLIMSDVDMPRLNGFELTTRIRADKKLLQTPVILLTSLDSQEDREYGIEVGANAYIVKSSFDQGNLIEVIRKLI